MRPTPLLGSDFPLDLHLPFTYRQALQAGITPRELRTLLEEQLVRRVLRGVYVTAQVPDSQLLRAQAMRLVVPQGHVVTDESAGWLAGADMILRPGAHLAVPPLTTFAKDGHHRLRNSVVLSGTRALLDRDITEIHGIPVTTPLRTALDLGRLRHRDRAIGALDQLLRLGVFTRDELLAELSRFRGMRGVRQLRVLAPIADGRSESPGESTLRLRFYDGNLPIPVPQVNIFAADGRFLGRGDLVIEELRFVAEYFGEKWHDEAQSEFDAARLSAFEAENWTVRVFRRDNLFGLQQDAIDIAWSGIREARRRLGGPEFA